MAFLFSRPVVKRGHDLPLENVDATDSDKRGEQGVCLLRKFGAVKTLVEVVLNNLDKRENRPQWITLWITTRHLAMSG